MSPRTLYTGWFVALVLLGAVLFGVGSSGVDARDAFAEFRAAETEIDLFDFRLTNITDQHLVRSAGIPTESLRVPQTIRPDFIERIPSTDERVRPGNPILAVNSVITQGVDTQNRPEDIARILAGTPRTHVTTTGIPAVTHADVKQSVIGIGIGQRVIKIELAHRVIE